MALPPKFAGHKLEFAAASPSGPAPASAPSSPHTLEVYADYCCPFSARLFATLDDAVAPAVRAHPPWARSLVVVFRHLVQPWHPSSTLMHEAVLAALRLAPARFWPVSAALFARQRDFFDVSVVAESRNQTYRRLAAVVAEPAGVDPDDVYALLAVPDTPGPGGALNVGNAVTNDLKLVTRMGRLVGIHVSPTVVFDGVVQDISSSWTEDQWKEWLAKNVV